jgi:hypothetical protein
MIDPTEYRARRRAVEQSAAIEVALKHEPNSPLLELLSRANATHAAAVAALATVDASDANEIRELQANIKTLTLLTTWMHEIVVEGKEAGNLLDAEARDEMAEFVGLNEDDTPHD